MVLKEYSGNAPTTRLASGLTQGAVISFTVISGGGTGYPSGASAPFVVVIDPDTAFEEKILVATRLGDDFNTLTRGYDGTLDQDHAGQAEVKHVWDAISATEANAHANNTTDNVHPQYVLDTDLTTILDTANYLESADHDLEARHTFGAAYGTPAAPASTGDANATGSGNNPAREDHVHKGVVANEALTTWTPFINQGGPNIEEGVNRCVYYRLGRMVFVFGDINVGGGTSGVAGEPISISVPVNAVLTGGGGTALTGAGQGIYFRSSGSTEYPFILESNGQNSFRLKDTTVADSYLGDAGAFTGAVAPGDRFIFSAFYEAES